PPARHESWGEELVNETQRLRSVEPVMVGHARAVAVGPERVVRQNDVCVAQENRAARISKTDPAFTLRRVSREFEELIAEAVMALNHPRRSEEAGEQHVWAEPSEP